MPKPPLASVVGARPSWRGLIDRLASPPRWARSLFSWSLSGAFAAAAANIFAWIARSGELMNVGLLGSLGVVAGSMLAAVVLIVPFLTSAGLYFLFFPHRTPRSAALWCLGFHVLAHLLVVAWFMGHAWHANLEAPVLIGALWGLWLPATINPEGLPDRGWA